MSLRGICPCGARQMGPAPVNPYDDLRTNLTQGLAVSCEQAVQRAHS